MNTKIKICGLKRREDIEAVNEAMPDYCGFIIDCPRSRRNVSKETAAALVKGLRKEILPVGVFVNAPVEEAAELLNKRIIAMAQLHGQEDEEYIKRLKELTHRPVIKAFSVQSAGDVQRAAQSSADYVLLDQGSGGTGKAFDWSLIREMDRPYFLAGGIGIYNLESAVNTLHPFAVDLSSSVETDGLKDRKKIIEAVNFVRKITQTTRRT